MMVAKAKEFLTSNSARRAQRTHRRRLERVGIVLLIVVSCISLGSCTISSEKLEFERAEKEAQARNFDAAIGHYKALVDRYVKTDLAVRAAKEAARINHYELKKFPTAVVFYKHIVLYSPNANDRLEAQKRIAELYFNHILDYAQAITEFNRLIELPHSKDEELQYRLSIARSYFYLSNFYQAEIEINTLLKKGFEKELLFEPLLLKANIFLTSKQLDSGIEVLKELMEKYPDRSRAETIGLVLAVTYEEKKDFAKAIETLQSIKDVYPRKSFIERRIKALKERQTYLPGARGLRK